MLSAGVAGVPLQAGLAPGNSLHDSPVSPADITPNRSIGPARAGRLHPHVGLFASVSAVASGSQQARIQGGAKGALAPPPHFLGKKQGGQKPHTQKKKRSKSDNHEARYRLKRTTKHTKYAKIF